MTDDAVRLAVVNRLSWIKKQQAQFESQPRQSEREVVTGETHFFFGRRYRLRSCARRRRGRRRQLPRRSRSTALAFAVARRGSTRDRELLPSPRSRPKYQSRYPTPYAEVLIQDKHHGAAPTA